MWWIGHTIGGAGGAALVFVILVALSGWMFHRSRQQHVGAHNVNEAWERPGGAHATASAPAAEPRTEPKSESKTR